jgi:hypothetical protein
MYSTQREGKFHVKYPNFKNDTRWHIFYTMKKLKIALEKPSTQPRGREILEIIDHNLRGLNTDEATTFPIEGLSKALSVVDKIILGINFGAPEWPNKLLDLYGPPVKCYVTPFIEEDFPLSDMQKFFPNWEQPCEWYLLPFDLEEQDSPLNLQFLSKHLDRAWAMYENKAYNRFALIFSPALSLLTYSYERFAWKDLEAFDWPEKIKEWFALLSHYTAENAVSSHVWDWQWDEIVYATSLFLDNIPPCQNKEKALDIKNILIAGSIVASYKVHSGASLEELTSLERLIAFACDGSLFLSRYQMS